MAVIFKFGGASVKDAESIKNIEKIINSYDEELIIVVSAMGKMTRTLHHVAELYFSGKSTDTEFKEIVKFHQSIISQLFGNKNIEALHKFNELSIGLLVRLGKEPSLTFDYDYDQIVPFGELFSAFIISEYLNSVGVKNKLKDIRKVLKTDSTYRDAKINWEVSERLVNENFNFAENKIYVTQGFIASDDKNHMTTLGLEGSDFTAASLAYMINAEKVVVWKDVEGIYNSDPSEVQNVVKLDAISYQEAVELAYFGAKVIHPKTIKPLQNKNIPLFVKSFLRPEGEGTVITESTPNKTGVLPEVPVFITKNNQILISIAPNDFSFIAEDNLEHIFSVLAKNRVKVNLMQNSAISFSVCVDYLSERILEVIKELRKKYKVLYNEDLTLITIRHYNKELIEEMTRNRKILVQQKSRHTARFVVE